MKVTNRDVEQILALKWDIDIEKSACDLILPEIIELALALRNKDRAILKFFSDLIGKPAFVDNHDGFVASEFVQKHGNRTFAAKEMEDLRRPASDAGKKTRAQKQSAGQT